MPTNAIYGFVSILRKLIREYNPGMITTVFDMKAPTVRHKKYKEYKIHRKPMPDDLVAQIPEIKAVIAAHKIPICQLEGYEADDIIATLAEEAKTRGLSVTIVTSDKDALQLVDDQVNVLSLHTSGDKVYDAAGVKEKYGVSPALIVDLMAFTGDASDNIPGVKGIGRFTAVKLIDQYGSFLDIYRNIENIPSKSIRKKLLEGKKTAEFSRELVQLDRSVPVKLDFDKARLASPDLDQLAELYREFEFEKLLREITPKEADRGRYSVKATGSAVEKMVKEIAEQKTVSLSVVSASVDSRITGIAFSWKEREACFVPLDVSQQQSGSEAREVSILVKGLLEDGAVKKTGYDIKKDMVALRSWGIEIRGIAFDVMIADYLNDPSRPRHDLAGIAMRHLGYNLSVEEESMRGCERSDIIQRLYGVLATLLKEKHLTALLRDVEMPLVSVLADMETHGVGVDIEYLKERSSAMEKKLADVSGKIYGLAGEEFNINSPRQLQVILYDKLGLPAIKKTKTGISTDESVLRKLAALHELPRLLLEYREMSKLKSGYYDSILTLVDKKTCKLHARFNQAVTATGRLSSSEPNLQNIPIKTVLGKEIRRAFVPSGKGKLLLAADYSQIELRILAHLSGDSMLIKAFKNGEDVHRFTASLIFDCPPGDVTGTMRSAAKTVNFGIVYGISPFGLSRDLEISVEEAQKFIDSYFDRYSGIRSFIDRTISGVREKGFVTTLLKRRRYIPEIGSANERVRGFAERVAVNTPVQGSAADLIKLAMIACHDEFKDTGVRMIIQVHDELIFEVPKDILKDTAKRVKDLMEGITPLKVPLKVDIEAGESWLDMEPVGIL